jgi:hypothetical protein
MAQQTISNGESGVSVRTKLNENFTEVYLSRWEYEASTIYSSVNAYKVFQELVGPTANDKAIEILNLGYTGHGSGDDIHQNTTGLVRINGRIDLVRNMRWNNSTAEWETPLQGATAYGSACVEVGGEACILHATPAGVNFSDVPHEILLAKASGTDGETNNTVSSGYYVQAKGTIYARFNSTAYDQAATNNCWNQTSGVQPLMWLSTAEAKNTINELALFEANADSSAAWPAVYFGKSRGNLASKTVAVTAEISGRIGWKVYDGDEYHITAAIEGATESTMANNSVPQALVFKTSASNTASLAERMRITKDGYIVITTLPTSSAGLATGTLWNDTGIVKVA